MAYEDLAPNYKINIGGSDVSAQLRPYIESIELDQVLGLTDSLKINFNNPIITRDDGTLGPLWTDSALLQEGNLVEVWLGYADLLQYGGGYYIQGHMPDFPESGEPSHEIEALDFSFRLMGDNDKGREFLNLADSEIVAQVISNGGYPLTLDIDPTTGKKTRIQKSGMSDFDFVTELARINGFEFYVNRAEGGGDTLHFKRRDPESQAATYVFKYLTDGDGTLLSFSPERTSIDQALALEVLWFNPSENRVMRQRVTASDVFPKKAKKRKKKATTEDRGPGAETGITSTFGGIPTDVIDEEIASGSEVRVVAFGANVKIISDRPFKSEEDVKKFAEEWFKEDGRTYIIGTGRVVGAETLRPGQVHRLEGIGNRLSGDYYFSRVTHKLTASGGYDCEMAAFKVASS